MFNSFDFGSVSGQSIFDQAIALGSQIVSAVGKNPTTQIASGPGGVFALPNPEVSIANAQSQAVQGQALVNAQLAARGNIQNFAQGDSLGGALNGFINFLTTNPTAVLLVGGGLFLLFLRPPGKR